MHYFNFSGSVVCVGSEWHRFPSSFFVPSYVGEVRWIDDGFRGLLPFPFNSTIGGTRAAPPYFNNKNKASDEQYVFFCPLLIYSGFSCMYFSIRFLVAFQWWQHPVFPDVTAQGSWCLYFPCGAGPEKAVSFSWKWLIEMGGKNQFNFYWFSIQQEHFIFTKTVVQHILAHLNTCVKEEFRFSGWLVLYVDRYISIWHICILLLLLRFSFNYMSMMAFVIFHIRVNELNENSMALNT